MEARALIKAAMEGRQMAYVPYSGYGVGAALLAKSGKVYRGCNVENSAFGPTNCAERTAFFKAISEGDREFARIAIVGAMEGVEADQPCAPCGVCRQVMNEFCDPETFAIILADGKDGELVFTLKEMLPTVFGGLPIPKEGN